MNRKLVFNFIGRLMQVLALLLLLPMAVSLIYKESSYLSFIITALISLAIGTLLRLLTRNYSDAFYAKEGFAIVALAWVCTSIIGALPFYLSGEVHSFVDAVFETTSGFTTTGASILNDIEALSHGILFWRSFTHWIGGMGVLVFLIAFVSMVSDRSIHILRAEMPGPIVGKLTPRSKDTSKVLYIIYFVLTIILIVLLKIGGMPLFDSIVHAFGTAGTGGFGIKADSIASYSSFCQWTITIFMFLFGINFNIFYLWAIKRVRSAVSSAEFWVYFAIVTVSIVLISQNVWNMYSSVEETLRMSAFHVASISSTTGYTIFDYTNWPTYSKAILFVLTCIGACAGSTAGGLKVTRVILLFKIIAKELKRLVHPRSISTVKFEGKEIDSQTQNATVTYFAIYMISIFLMFLIVSLEPFDFETNFSAVVTCFNNVGPGFSKVGPAFNFSIYSDFSKLLLSFAMIMGRLEIFPILIALVPSTWKKK